MSNQRFESAPSFRVNEEPVVIQLTEGSTSELLSLKSHDGTIVASIGPSGAIESTSPSTFNYLTVTGNASLPENTSIGSVSQTEISYLDGVTSGIQVQLNLKSPLESPVFTGTPTAPTATSGTNTAQLATTEFVRNEISNLVSSAPNTLDTLDELAAALGDDANFATTVTNSIATKAPLDSPALTGTPTAPTATPGTNSTQIATTAFAKELVDSFLPAGMISPFAGTSTPDGWLLCAGQTVSRETYARLFTAIGTTYNTGGEAGTVFRLPDLRGRVIAGLDNMGTDPRPNRLTSTTITGGADALGETGGAQTHTLDINQIPSVAAASHTHGAGSYAAADHGHGPGSFTAAIGATNNDPSRIGYIAGTITGPGTATYSLVGSGLITGTGNFNHYTPIYGSSSGSAPAVTGSSGQSTNAGGGQAHNNVQPTIVLNYIIKA